MTFYVHRVINIFYQSSVEIFINCLYQGNSVVLFLFFALMKTKKGKQIKIASPF